MRLISYRLEILNSSIIGAAAVDRLDEDAHVRTKIVGLDAPALAIVKVYP